jgi:small subunit ribosomal protein S3
MKERIFITKAKEHVALVEFLRKQFGQAKFGDIEVQHTPVVTRIIVYTTTPGLVIGSGGERVQEVSAMLKKKFGIENPQIDVQKISNPDLNATVVAQSIVSAIENGVNHKKLGNFYLQKIMNAGAIGCELVFSGKISGERSRKVRFAAGYLKKSGKPSEDDVVKGFAVANPRLGNIGITVKIMIRYSQLKLKDEAKEPEEVPAEDEHGNTKTKEDTRNE